MGSVRSHHRGGGHGTGTRHEGGKVDRRRHGAGQALDILGVGEAGQHSQDGNVALRGDLPGVLGGESSLDTGRI